MEAIPSEQVDNALAMIKVLRRAMEMYPNEKELQAKLKDRISKLEKAITKNRLERATGKSLLAERWA